jgi:hypothetical protein
MIFFVKNYILFIDRLIYVVKSFNFSLFNWK